MSAILWPEQYFIARPGSLPAHTGRHYLSGTVKIDGTPGSRRVALFSRSSLDCIAVTRSRRDGSYSFSGLPEYPERDLFAVAFDDDSLDNPARYNAQCNDLLTQIQYPAVEQQEQSEG